MTAYDVPSQIQKVYGAQHHPQVLGPAMQDVRIAFIAAGSAACHCLAGGMDGKLYTWGRNEVCHCTVSSVPIASSPIVLRFWKPKWL